MDGAHASPDFDEHFDAFLVDYVDGTMDAATRAAFEEYLALHPDYAEQVRCMCQLRQALAGMRDRPAAAAPPGFQRRLRHRLACEMCPEPATPVSAALARPHVVATCAALLVVLLAAAVVSTTDVDPADAPTVQAPVTTSPSAVFPAYGQAIATPAWQRLSQPLFAPAFRDRGPRSSAFEDSSQTKARPLVRGISP